ncbi:MAG TPA: sensor domain-containing diguanylate cyclase [Byssovorax sp.]|jgi:diguanylate cyclase (GGDEF)-like protein
MRPLVALALWTRRAARAAAPGACTLGLAAVVVADAASPLPLAYAVPAAAGLVALTALRCARRARTMGRARSVDGSLALDLEVGGLLVTTAFAAAERLDGLDGRGFPLVYLAVAVVAAFARPGAAAVAAAFAVALEAGAQRLQGDLSPARLGVHAALAAAFVALNVSALRAEIARTRRLSRARVEAELVRVKDDARSYRLLGAPASARPAVNSDEDRLARSGVEEIHQSVLFALRLLRESLALHTAILLWNNDDGTHLRISELASDAQDLSEGPFLVGDGVFGAVLAQRSRVCLSGLKPSAKLPYYAGACPVRAVCALPVFEHGALRGMLVVDRIDDKAFTPREQELVDEAARYAVRAIQNERVFVQLERAKVEQGKLYRAAQELGAATTESAVVEAGVKSAREITSVDFAAVTLFDEAQRMHEIRAVSGEGALVDGRPALLGQRFRHNTGLVSMVLQNRHPLPYRGEYDAARQIVFTRKVAPPQMPSIVVLPLVVHERPLGTLVLGSRRRAAFHEAARGALEVLASHMAVSLSNARMLRRLEELATMDGLTGLLNKRAMLEVAEQKILAAKRFGRHLSVLITDIDHFKNVNDTHGHDVGDVVIKGLGEILRRMKRNTDAVARFGGEEFVIICEETDGRGALLLAERVREELERTTFHPQGKGALEVKVTCSIGVATLGEAGERWDELFKGADEALYVSKRSGRNRSTPWAPSMRQKTA